MFDEYNCADWIDDQLKELIMNEIVYNDDIEEILYDDDWELFKKEDFLGGGNNGKNEAV